MHFLFLFILSKLEKLSPFDSMNSSRVFHRAFKKALHSSSHTVRIATRDTTKLRRSKTFSQSNRLTFKESFGAREKTDDAAETDVFRLGVVFGRFGVLFRLIFGFLRFEFIVFGKRRQ